MIDSSLDSDVNTTVDSAQSEEPKSLSMRRRRWRLSVVALLILWFIGFTLFLGERPWSSRGEPREALVAQSILTSGNWILGEGYGGVVPSKPPVLHWSAAALAELISPIQLSEFVMRLPSSLAALALLLLVARLSMTLYPGAPPLLAPLVMASTVEFWSAGTAARVDMLLSAAMFAALLALYSVLASVRSYSAGAGGAGTIALRVSVASVLLSVAVLTKGPVGLVLPCGIVGLFWLFEYRTKFLKALLQSLVLFVPATLALAIAGIWYFEAYRVGGQQFFDRVVYENVLRFLGDQEDKPHYHPAWHLLLMFLVGLLPWVLVPLRLLLGGMRDAGLSKSIACVVGWYRELPELARLLVWWIVLVILFFCLPASKRSVYLLPVYPALAVLCVPLFARLSAGLAGRLVGGLFLISGVALAVLFFGGAGFLIPLLSTKYVGMISELASIAVGRWGFLSMALALMVGGVFLLWRSGDMRVGRAALVCLVLMGVMQGSLLAIGAKALSPNRFANQVSPLVGNARLLSFGYEFYGLSFYLKKRISRIDSVVPEPGDILFLFTDRREELRRRGIEYEFVARSYGSVERVGKQVLAVRIVGIVPPTGKEASPEKLEE